MAAAEAAGSVQKRFLQCSRTGVGVRPTGVPGLVKASSGFGSESLLWGTEVSWGGAWRRASEWCAPFKCHSGTLVSLVREGVVCMGAHIRLSRSLRRGMAFSGVRRASRACVNTTRMTGPWLRYGYWDRSVSHRPSPGGEVMCPESETLQPLRSFLLSAFRVPAWLVYLRCLGGMEAILWMAMSGSSLRE